LYGSIVHQGNRVQTSGLPHFPASGLSDFPDFRLPYFPLPEPLQISADVFKVVVTQVCQYPKNFVPDFSMVSVWCVKGTLYNNCRKKCLYWLGTAGAKKTKAKTKNCKKSEKTKKIYS
jgi:hypothetical protein